MVAETQQIYWWVLFNWFQNTTCSISKYANEYWFVTLYLRATTSKIVKLIFISEPIIFQCCQIEGWYKLLRYRRWRWQTQHITSSRWVQHAANHVQYQPVSSVRVNSPHTRTTPSSTSGRACIHTLHCTA